MQKPSSSSVIGLISTFQYHISCRTGSANTLLNSILVYPFCLPFRHADFGDVDSYVGEPKL